MIQGANLEYIKLSFYFLAVSKLCRYPGRDTDLKERDRKGRSRRSMTPTPPAVGQSAPKRLEYIYTNCLERVDCPP